MKLESINIKNLRSFREAEIPLHDYTRLVGPNGAGKSTVLCALNILFRSIENSSTDVTRLTEEDFHGKNTSDPVQVTVTFRDLSPEAQEDFKDYYRQGKLVITAEAKFDPIKGFAEVKQFGQRVAMKIFADFFKKLGDGAKVKELQEDYLRLRSTCTELPSATTKDAMVGALHQYEEAHPEACELIPSEDQFYGVSKGTNRLAKYVQWVYVPAVKDAAGEQYESKGSALTKLLTRAIDTKTTVTEKISHLRKQSQEKYKEILFENQGALDGITDALQRKLIEWAHPDASVRLAWRDEPDKSVKLEDPSTRVFAGENGFEGELARFGHGLQRSYLLALLHEIADVNNDAGPTLILGCEEPELFQHPPQARHLSMVLNKIAENGQVLITTHSPLFIGGEEFESIRYVRRMADQSSSVTCLSFSRMADSYYEHVGQRISKLDGSKAKVHQALVPHLSEMFFTRKLVLVEGLEDIAYINCYIALSGSDKKIRAKGIHFVPANGKSEIIQPLLIATGLEIPTFVIFDSDADKPDRSGSRAKHEKDNKAILSITKNADASPFPDETIWRSNLVMWFSDIGSTIQSEVGEDWRVFSAKADAAFGHLSNMKKNTLHIGETMALAWDAGHRFSVLARLIHMITS